MYMYVRLIFALQIFFSVKICINFSYRIAGNFRWVLIFHDFADCIRSRENKNRNNLIQQKFKVRFIWNRKNKNQKNYLTHFYL